MNPATQKFDDAQDLPDENDATAHAVRPDEAVPSEPAMRTSLVAAHAHAPLPAFEDDPPYPPRNTGVTLRRVLLAIGAIVVIGLAYVGYVLFSDNSDSEDIVGDQAVSISQDARTTTGTIAPFAPAQSNRPAAAVKPATPAPTAKITPPAPAVPAAPAVAPQVVAPPVIAAPVKPALQFRDATQALQTARLAFRANDLSAAQAALGAALALQPGNRDAQDLAAELRPLTTRRDSALQAAQTCVAQQSWPCARAHANEALTIDTGNDTAKGILERVIRETGWTPLNSHATAAGPAQGKPPAQAQTTAATTPAAQQVQVQTPLPQGMPANGDLSAAAPLAGAAGTAGGATNSADARERAIKDSGWTRAPSNGSKASTGAPSSQ